MRKLLRPTNEYAPVAILPGDPQVALELAQELIEGPLMANHARGLWGYTGPEKDNSERRLSIQSTGYGSQSAAAVVHQLAGLGVERVIRIGTCLALDERLGTGDHVLIDEAIGHDATPRAAAEELTASLEAVHPGPLVRGRAASLDTLAGANAMAPDSSVVDGTTAGLFAGAAETHTPAAALLLVVEAAGDQLGDGEARDAMLALGQLAAKSVEVAAQLG